LPQLQDVSTTKTAIFGFVSLVFCNSHKSTW